ncbi:hypothetical protein IG605_017315 [Pectobacterium quasiaquaticum]|uniref:hypothetical protein n=1 Tax=Pectobacterium quasiaquaticum TaxID=2774015 RepID=UPI001D64B5F8|nr:hypothetical protein [Pectobacterium quasiaquaticum]URG54813.1 hypothetical protein IG605_017315 [Pectobacterium quasiaquaticum]
MNIDRLIRIESGLPSFGKLAHYTQIGRGSNKRDEMILNPAGGYVRLQPDWG